MVLRPVCIEGFAQGEHIQSSYLFSPVMMMLMMAMMTTMMMIGKRKKNQNLVRHAWVTVGLFYLRVHTGM